MTDTPVEREQGKHLSDVDIGKILGLAKALCPQRKIATLMKCGRKAVQRVLTTYLFETFQGRKSRRAYERKTTTRQDNIIVRTIKQNYDIPLHDITNIINNTIKTTVSERTVRRRRSESGLGSYIAAEKPGLRPENVTERLKWALRYKDWTIEDWKRVIWSDESSIWIGVNP